MANPYQLLTRVPAGEQSSINNPIIAQALQALQHKAFDPLYGIEALAAQLQIHRATLCRQFTGAVGMSPIEYLTQMRVQNALTLLKQTTLCVGEIARQCGYTDPNYFSRLIRRHAGYPPLHFRRDDQS